MAVFSRSAEKKRILQDLRRHEEDLVIGSLCRLGSRPISPKSQMEQERRIRREIANSNERRRMQSINAGFQSLRTLLPHNEGEKLSKAAILQQTAQYIYHLEQEKTRLLTQNCQMKRMVNQHGQDSDGGSSVDSPVPKRKKIVPPVESSDEEVGLPSVNQSSDEPSLEVIKREMIDLRVQLERERRIRMMLEEHTRGLEAQLYPEKIREIAHQVQLQYQRQTNDPNGITTVIGEGVGTDSSVGPEGEAAVSLKASEVVVEPAPLNEMTIQEESLNGYEEDETLDAEVAEEVIPAEESPLSPFHGSSRPSRTLTPPNLPVQVIPMPPQPPGFINRSRQNLETIVEAIRHLEGDHLFKDDDDDPLPLTRVESPKMQDVAQDLVIKSPRSPTKSKNSHCQNWRLHIDPHQHHHHHTVQPARPIRPGVIVSAHT